MLDKENMDSNVQANVKVNLIANRRDFLKKAAITSPLLTTITPKSVFASDLASISGNLSGNTSHIHEVAQIDGCSPGYYHKHDKGNVNTGPTIRNTGISFDALFSDYLSTSYSTTANCSDTLEIVLNPKLWKVQFGWTCANQLHRMAITAYLNTLEFPGVFPYSTSQIVDFYSKIGDTVSISEAMTIFQNLIHGGLPESYWKDRDDAICGV